MIANNTRADLFAETTYIVKVYIHVFPIEKMQISINEAQLSIMYDSECCIKVEK